MSSRGRRRLVVLALVALCFIYLQVATHVEQNAIAAQRAATASADRAASSVDRERLLADVRALSAPEFEGRRTGSPGGLKARQWVTARFKELGLAPVANGGFLQPFSFTHRSVRGLVTPGRPFETEYRDAANVIGRIEGTRPGAPALVLSAHYDHLGVRDGALYPGADDNASGVATVLAAARYFNAHPLQHPLVIVAFDAEELGLRGARALVDSGLLPRDRVLVNVNLDMVSRSDRNEIFAAGTYHAPWLKPILQDVQTRARVKILLGHDRPMHLAGNVEDWTEQSDHGAFHDAGIPFVYFGVEDHADYHRPTDTADKIDPQFFGDTADMIVDAVRTLDARQP